jgi:hypothetical protein
MKELNINELDPGIRRHVVALRDAGFETKDSGDGISKKGGPGEACMWEYPNVFIRLASDDDMVAEAERALGVLLGVEPGWHVEASWSTHDRTKVLICVRGAVPSGAVP